AIVDDPDPTLNGAVYLHWHGDVTSAGTGAEVTDVNPLVARNVALWSGSSTTINLTGAWWSGAWTSSQHDYTINLTVSSNGVTVTHNGINVSAIDPNFPTGVVGT